MSHDKQIPEFHSYEEIAEFWDTHSLADYWEQTEARGVRDCRAGS